MTLLQTVGSRTEAQNWNVHVHRQRLRRAARHVLRALPATPARSYALAEGVAKLVGGGIRGVARPWRIEAAQQRLGKAAAWRVAGAAPGHRAD